MPQSVVLHCDNSALHRTPKPPARREPSLEFLENIHQHDPSACGCCVIVGLNEPLLRRVSFVGTRLVEGAR